MPDSHDVNPYQAPSIDADGTPDPLSIVGSILVQGWQLVDTHWPLMAAVVFVVWTPIYGVSNYMSYETSADQLTELLIILPLDFIGECLVTGSVLAIAIWAAEGQPPTFMAAMQRSVAVLPKFLITYLFCSLVIGMGIVLLILPGLYLAIRLSLVDSIVVKEGRSLFAAMQGSFTLSAGNFWPLAGLCTLYFLLLAVPEIAFTLAAAFYTPLDNWIASTISDLIGAMVALYPITFMYLAYRRLVSRGYY